MRILLITPHFYPENFKTNDLTDALTEAGHQVTVLTGQPHYPFGRVFAGYSNWTRWRDHYGETEIIRFPIFPRGKGKSWQLALNYFSFLLSSLILGLPRARGRNFDASLVFASSPITVAIPGLVFKKFSGVPLVVWVQDIWPESVQSVGAIRHPLLIKGLSRMVSWIYAHCDRILIQSEAFRPSVLKHGAKPENVKLLCNWTDASIENARTSKREKSSEFNILYAGNLGKAQALDSVMEAVRLTQDSNLKWRFLGDGPFKNRLMEQAALFGLKNIEFLDPVAVQQVPEYLGAADALLLPLAEEEAFLSVIPSKTQAYLSTGRPILAHARGAVANLIAETSTGLVSHPRDAKALAENALALSQWPKEEIERIAGNGLNTYKERFSRQAGIQNLLSHLEQVSHEK
jgi:colanic acid biosynthesis glycosyl transferase WcaI